MVAVDGPAGSGKTTFAARLTAYLPGAAVVHVDDVLAGWSDLEGWFARFAAEVLEPLAAGRPGRYVRWDWLADAPGAVVSVPAAPVLVVEGVGSARRAAARWLAWSAFVTAPRQVRLARGVERDGPALRERWLRWMADEDAHFAAERTAARADLVVDGEPQVPHDPAREYVAVARGEVTCPDDGTCAPL